MEGDRAAFVFLLSAMSDLFFPSSFSFSFRAVLLKDFRWTTVLSFFLFFSWSAWMITWYVAFW